MAAIRTPINQSAPVLALFGARAWRRLRRRAGRRGAKLHGLIVVAPAPSPASRDLPQSGGGGRLAGCFLLLSGAFGSGVQGLADGGDDAFGVGHHFGSGEAEGLVALLG